MPELPEVEVVRRGLEQHVVGRTISSVEVLHERPVRRDVGGPAGFATSLTGRTITAARRRGKFLWLPLDDGRALMGHLGMSGQMLVQPAGADDERHLRVRFRFVPRVADYAGDAVGRGASAGERLETSSELRFVDQRMFGGLWLAESGVGLEDPPPEIAHIARDPLDPAFDAGEVVTRIRRSSSGIKRLLLDQRVLSGVGNIYADEALWRARIHGERPGSKLTRAHVLELLGHVLEVMTAALEQGGTSFDALYVNVNGQSGYFDRSLHAYGREGEPCDRCGTPIRRIAFANRSSYFCPTCQPRPRPPRVGV